ncbi:MAG: CapA family protein [Eubacteriales bacterium]
MGHEPASTNPSDPKDPSVAEHVRQSAAFSKILRIICGSLAFLTIALIWGPSFPTKEIGAATGQSTAYSGSPVTSEALSTSAASIPQTESSSTIPAPSSAPSPTPVPTASPEIRATITAVGDIIMHKSVIDGGLTNPGEAMPVYNYNTDFQFVSPIFEASNLAMGNFEGTLNGPPYSGFPSFSAPDAIADSLYTAGFRVICTANNHCIDKGLDGLIRTASVFRDAGLTVIGTRPDTAGPMDTVEDLGGIKVGLLNYTFETPGTEQRKTINGIPLPDGADLLIDSFNPYREPAYERDMAAIFQRVDELRRQGAEIICLTLHWGEEYNTHSVAWQQKMAQDLCDGGIDLIIGHHPHVLEEIDVLTSAATGKQTLVYYSLGNFLGNWNYGSLGTAGKAQDGMIARVTFLKTADGVTIEKGEYIPTNIVRIPKGSGLQHLIVPVLPALSDPAAYQTTTAEMQASYDRINKILGPCKETQEIPVMEAAS